MKASNELLVDIAIPDTSSKSVRTGGNSSRVVTRGCSEEHGEDEDVNVDDDPDEEVVVRDPGLIGVDGDPRYVLLGLDSTVSQLSMSMMILRQTLMLPRTVLLV